jgi:hypothetical protein
MLNFSSDAFCIKLHFKLGIICGNFMAIYTKLFELDLLAKIASHGNLIGSFKRFRAIKNILCLYGFFNLFGFGQENFP